MLVLIVIFALIIFAFVWFRAKISVDFKSIFRATLPLDMGKFGVYCFTGKQGSGKTYSLTKYIKKNSKGRKIYSNLHIVGIEYVEIKSVEGLLNLREEENLFIIFDEIFTLLNDKTIPKDIRDDLMEFLSQQRKMKNILLTTAQEWLNIPIEFRRFVRIQISCLTIPLGRFGGVLIEDYYNAYEMKWDNLENEYVAPHLNKKISKYEKRYMEAYDTYARIRKLSRKESDAHA
jgi:hypothetical protein